MCEIKTNRIEISVRRDESDQEQEDRRSNEMEKGNAESEVDEKQSLLKIGVAKSEVFRGKLWGVLIAVFPILEVAT